MIFSTTLLFGQIFFNNSDQHIYMKLMYLEEEKIPHILADDVQYGVGFKTHTQRHFDVEGY